MKKIPISIECNIQFQIPEHVFSLGQKSIEEWVQERFLEDCVVEKKNNSQPYYVGLRDIALWEIFVDDSLTPEYAAAAAIAKVIDLDGYEYIEKKNKTFCLKQKSKLFTGKVWDKSGIEIKMEDPSSQFLHWVEFKKLMEFAKNMPVNVRKPWIQFNDPR